MQFKTSVIAAAVMTFFGVCAEGSPLPETNVSSIDQRSDVYWIFRMYAEGGCKHNENTYQTYVNGEHQSGCENLVFKAATAEWESNDKHFRGYLYQYPDCKGLSQYWDSGIDSTCQGSDRLRGPDTFQSYDVLLPPYKVD